MSDNPDDHGALVGWTAQRLGDRLILRLQSVTKPPPHDDQDIAVRHIMMDRQQALQLGHFLFEMFDESKPAKRAGWLARLLGN